MAAVAETTSPPLFLVIVELESAVKMLFFNPQEPQHVHAHNSTHCILGQHLVNWFRWAVEEGMRRFGTKPTHTLIVNASQKGRKTRQLLEVYDLVRAHHLGHVEAISAETALFHYVSSLMPLAVPRLFLCAGGRVTQWVHEQGKFRSVARQSLTTFNFAALTPMDPFVCTSALVTQGRVPAGLGNVQVLPGLESQHDLEVAMCVGGSIAMTLAGVTLVDAWAGMQENVAFYFCQFPLTEHEFHKQKSAMQLLKTFAATDSVPMQWTSTVCLFHQPMQLCFGRFGSHGEATEFPAVWPVPVGAPFKVMAEFDRSGLPMVRVAGVGKENWPSS